MDLPMVYKYSSCTPFSIDFPMSDRRELLKRAERKCGRYLHTWTTMWTRKGVTSLKFSSMGCAIWSTVAMIPLAYPLILLSCPSIPVPLFSPHSLVPLVFARLSLSSSSSMKVFFFGSPPSRVQFCFMSFRLSEYFLVNLEFLGFRLLIWDYCHLPLPGAKFWKPRFKYFCVGLVVFSLQGAVWFFKLLLKFPIFFAKDFCAC